MKKVMVFGAYDILHKGHRYFLEQARAKGDHLTVVVGRDLTIKNIKGRFPHENEEMRAKNLREEGLADNVILGDLKKHLKHIDEEKPNIICLGYDQEAFTEKLKKYIDEKDLDIKMIRIQAYQPKKFKSSIIREDMERI